MDSAVLSIHLAAQLADGNNAALHPTRTPMPETVPPTLRVASEPSLRRKILAPVVGRGASTAHDPTATRVLFHALHAAFDVHQHHPSLAPPAPPIVNDPFTLRFA